MARLIVPNNSISTPNVDKMRFKYSIRGFSKYLFAKGGYVVRLPYTTKHLHYKEARLISFDKSNRIYLWSDSGKKERLSKRLLKKLLIEITPIEINLYSEIKTTPF